MRKRQEKFSAGRCGGEICYSSPTKVRHSAGMENVDLSMLGSAKKVKISKS